MSATNGRNRRRALIAVTAAALAAAAAIATPAVASTVAHSHSGTAVAGAAVQSKAERQVDALLTQYRAAIDSEDPEQTPEQVRSQFLTEACNSRLHTWEDHEHADGVFRAQNMPVSWTTRYEGSGAGHTSVAVTFDWGGTDNTSEVWYQVRISDLRVSDVTDAPS